QVLGRQPYEIGRWHLDRGRMAQGRRLAADEAGRSLPHYLYGALTRLAALRAELAAASAEPGPARGQDPGVTDGGLAGEAAAPPPLLRHGLLFSRRDLLPEAPPGALLPKQMTAYADY